MSSQAKEGFINLDDLIREVFREDFERVSRERANDPEVQKKNETFKKKLEAMNVERKQASVSVK